MTGLRNLSRLLAAVIILASPSAARAGGAIITSKVASALGVVAPATQQTFRIGDSFNCKVAAPSRLGSYGLVNLTVNQLVRITVTGARAFTVTAGGVSTSFIVDEQGVVKKS